MIDTEILDRIVRTALEEDVGMGDITSELTIAVARIEKGAVKAAVISLLLRICSFCRGPRHQLT